LTGIFPPLTAGSTKNWPATTWFVRSSAGLTLSQGGPPLIVQVDGVCPAQHEIFMS
jgi:hypothetical protein